MKITRLRISNFRGIAELDHTVSADGVVAKGKNGAGKSTVLHAIQAALASRDIKGDAVRLGADRAEIIVDLDAVEAATVTRTIPRDGASKVVVKGADGVPRKRPTELLEELLGGAALDPLDLMALDPKARRAKVLASMPIEVSDAALREWGPDLPEGFAVKPGEHGLVAVERAHASLYEARTLANKEAERTKAEATMRAAESAKALEGIEDPFLSLGDADAGLQRARARYADLAAGEKQHAAHLDRTSKARARIAALRDESAEAWIEDAEIALLEEHLRGPTRDVEAHRDEVRRLEVAAAKAKQALADGERGLAMERKRIEDAAEGRAKSAALAEQATELETTIDAAAPEAPDHAAVAESIEAVARAEAQLAQATRAEAARAVAAVAQGATERAAAAAAAAKRLDVQVKALANDAPKALLARADGIEGLEILGDDVALDGVRSGALCGMEATWFCCQIAMKLAKAKILICDGVERLDAEQFAAFVAYVHDAGFQLIASRVEKLPNGSPDMVLEAVSP